MKGLNQSQKFIVLGILVATLTFFCVNFTPFYWLSAKVTDGFLKGFQTKQSENLVLVLIDDQSLRRLGRFPFDRKVYALLLENLKEAGASVVVFDILFVEPTNSDEVLAKAMKNFGKVILGVNLSREGETKIDKRLTLATKFSPPIKAQGVVLPPKPLLDACFGIGFVYPFPDKDGVCRTLPLAVELEPSKLIVPSISLAATMAFYGVPQLKPKSLSWGSRKLNLGEDWDIPILLPFSPNQVSFKSLSFIKILEGNFEPESVKGKIVLVGFAASGLADRFPTSSDPLALGIEIHAATINALLTGQSPTYAPIWVQLFASSFLCALVSAFAYLWRFRLSLISFFLTLFIVYGFVLILIRQGVIVLPMPVMLSMLLAFAVSLGLKADLQEETIDRLRAYVAQPVAEFLTSIPEWSRTGERREITVFFSDIRDFIPVAASLTPYEVVTLLESYFNRMTEIVNIFGGVIDKFLGDGMMVLFGVLPNQIDHAQRAVLCAWQMLEELSTVNWEWERVAGSPLKIGIGVNTGVAIVAVIGTEWRKEFTALGSTVNLAQRLEQLTKEVGASLIVGEETYKQVDDLVLAETIEVKTVKGFDQTIVAYKVLGLTEKGKQLRSSILATKV
ncbi:MAG: adenylate/guanylate cyclase domain-containing protein [Armatimonadetes bacterium]|nr:adenylate/guanylate cyclase domain-containing protein [Armatimonadota bacterium]MDW8027798.1 adenylate/guanylate cyclase domain-containing protein [Armatimonadota bacterium]